MAKEKYYTPERVAKLAGVVVQTIYRHLENDRFPGARRIGMRKWFIPEDSVIQYIGYDPNVTEIELVK